MTSLPALFSLESLPRPAGEGCAPRAVKSLPPGPAHGAMAAASLPASPALQLAHPNWLIYSKVDVLARKLGADAKHVNRGAVSGSLRAMWRTPSGVSFDEQIMLETSREEFFKELVFQGGAPGVAACLELLYRLCSDGIPLAEFNPVKAKLCSAATRLRQGIKAGLIAQPVGWGIVERQARISAIQFDPTLEAERAQRAVQVMSQALSRDKDKQVKKLAREAQALSAREEATARRQALQASLHFWWAEQGELPGDLSPATYRLLQEPMKAHQFKAAFGEFPSPLALQRACDLSAPALLALEAYQLGVDRDLEKQAQAKRLWTRSLVAGVDVPGRLFITSAEYEKWVADGRLAVAQRVTHRKGGKEHLHLMHDPAELNRLSSEKIEVFRSNDLKDLPGPARQAWTRGIDKLRAKQALALVVAAIPAQHGCRAMEPTPTRLGWTKSLALKFPVTENGNVALWQTRVQVDAFVAFPSNKGEIDALADKVGNAFSATVQADIVRKLSSGVQAILTEYAAALTRDQSTQLCDALKKTLNNGLVQNDLNDGGARALLQGPAGELIKSIEEKRARDLLKLQDYPQAFGMARSLGRSVHFKLGPTNSGKTHEALEALKNAHSGLYLAPLRLLAMEIRDRLTAAGIPCNLLTGEEHDLVPGARHTACTVEMMDPTREVEVAVLDEIQMLLDDQRGWAWTSALVGAPARDVYVCGADSVHKACVRVLDSLGELHDTTYLERKTPLEVEGMALSPSKGNKFAARGLQRGDAVIAFSRKDVLTLSARYRAYGYSVSTIYGALAPEVRRAESERFASGESDIVVATDAIGMGLNLPIRRVVFSTVHKFDGEAVRPLNPTELRQIAGRAGRFGMHPKGLVAALDSADLPHIRQMLAVKVPNQEIVLPIAPSLWHIEALAQLLGTADIGEVLTFFTSRIAAESSLFETAGMEDTISLAHVVDRLAPELSLQEKFVFSCAPVSIEKDSEFGYFETCLKAYVSERRLKLPDAGVCLDDDAGRNLLDAEYLSKDLSLYAWLSFKYPETFFEFEALSALRTRVSRYIEKGLLMQGGFGMTSRESFEGRRRGPRA